MFHQANGDLEAADAGHLDGREATLLLRAAGQWWQQGSPDNDIYILRLALAPQIRIMQEMLASTSSHWEVGVAIDAPGLPMFLLVQKEVVTGHPWSKPLQLASRPFCLNTSSPFWE